MKRSELIFNIISIFVDAGLVVLSASSAYFLRYRAENFLPQYPIIFDLSYDAFIRNLAIALPVVILIFALNGLYNLSSTRGYREILFKVGTSVTVSLMLFVAIYFFDQEIFPSRLIVLMTWIFTIVIVSLGRLILLMIERFFMKRGIGLHKLVLILDGGRDYNLQNEITHHPEYGYKIVATLQAGEQLITDMDKIIKDDGVDEILSVNLDLDRSMNERLLKLTHDNGIVLNYLPNIIESQRSNISTTDIAGLPIIRLKNTPLEGWGRVVKRTLDAVTSLVGIILLSPIFLIIIVLIKLTSPGKIFYVQERFGQGKSFKFYKFRTMHQHLSVGEEYGGTDAEKVRTKLWETNARKGPFLKIKNDPRVTTVGRFLRRTKLDELPQLFNVLTGSMSLVGPRAHVLEEVNLYREKYRRQFTIKPGITGLAQISQVKDPELSFEDEIRLNTFYLENWSLKLDFLLLFRTIIALVQNVANRGYY